MLAGIKPLYLLFSLPEIELLRREKLRTNRLGEIVVGYLAILVAVEFIVEPVKLLLRQTPA